MIEESTTASASPSPPVQLSKAQAARQYLKDFLVKLRDLYTALPPSLRLLLIPTFISIIILLPKVLDLHGGYLAFVLVIAVFLTFIQNTLLYVEQDRAAFFKFISSVTAASFEYVKSINDTKTNRLFNVITQKEIPAERMVRIARHQMKFDVIVNVINKALFEIIKIYVRTRRKTVSIEVVLVLVKPDHLGFCEKIGDACQTAGSGNLAARIKQINLKSSNSFASILWRGSPKKIKSTSDTIKSFEKNEFVILDEDEKDYLKSLVCYRIDDPDGHPLMMWCVDADHIGAFPDDSGGNKRNRIEMNILTSVFAIFEKLLLYELNLTNIIDKTVTVVGEIQERNAQLQSKISEMERTWRPKR